MYYTRDRERGNICGGQSGETPGLIRVKTSLIRAVNEWQSTRERMDRKHIEMKASSSKDVQVGVGKS